MKVEKIACFVCLVLVLGMVSLSNASTLVSRYQFNDASDDQGANPLTDNGLWTMGAGVADTTSGHSIMDFGGNGKGVSNVGYLESGKGHLMYSNAAHPKQNFSFAAWVKADAAAVAGNLGFGIYDNDLGSGQSISLQVASGNTTGPYTYVAGDIGGFTWDPPGVMWTIDTSTNGNDGQWHHVAHVLDMVAQTNSLYVDGVLKDVATIGAAGQGPGARMRLGSNAAVAAPNGGAFYDDVQIYDGVISAADITTIKNGGFVPEPATMTLLGLGSMALIRRKRKIA
jgi:hypothetical protein